MVRHWTRLLRTEEDPSERARMIRSRFINGFGLVMTASVLVIVLVLFGGSSLPKLAKNLGKAQKEFKDGLSEANKADAPRLMARPTDLQAPA